MDVCVESGVEGYGIKVEVRWKEMKSLWVKKVATTQNAKPVQRCDNLLQQLPTYASFQFSP